jgi:hypothetical protein
MSLSAMKNADFFKSNPKTLPPRLARLIDQRFLRTLKRLAAEIHVDNAAGLAQKRECQTDTRSGKRTTTLDSRFKAAGASCFVEGGHEPFSINSLGAALFSLGLGSLSGTVAQNGRLRSALRPKVLEIGT